jgi:cell division protein FtsW (lipid II flippase)
MANSVYKINKGINKPLEFKGLKAQYIWYLGAGLVILLILFAALYLIGVPPLICIALIVILAGILFTWTYSVSNKYGEHGMMKQLARRRLPSVVRSYSRKMFLKRDSDGKNIGRDMANHGR